MTDALRELARRWRDEAGTLRHRYRDEPRAAVFELVAAELLDAVREEGKALLRPDEAAAYSGYSKSQLRRMVAEGRLPNHGAVGSPLYAKSQLPTKASHAGYATLRRRG